MPDAADLNTKVAFEQRGPDGNGDPLGAWVEVFTRFAEVTWLRGGEAVQQQRLNGQQPIAVAVRLCAQTRAVDNSWRLRLVHLGAVFDIQSAQPNAKAPRDFRDFLATESKGG